MPLRLGAAIDRVQALAERHRRAIGWVSTGWLVLVGLSHAGLFALPALDFLDSRAAMIAGVVWNAAWWGAIRPMLERRSVARRVAQAEAGRA